MPKQLYYKIYLEYRDSKINKTTIEDCWITDATDEFSLRDRVHAFLKENGFGLNFLEISWAVMDKDQPDTETLDKVLSIKHLPQFQCKIKPDVSNITDWSQKGLLSLKEISALLENWPGPPKQKLLVNIGGQVVETDGVIRPLTGQEISSIEQVLESRRYLRVEYPEIWV